MRSLDMNEKKIKFSLSLCAILKLLIYASQVCNLHDYKSERNEKNNMNIKEKIDDMSKVINESVQKTKRCRQA